MHAIVLRADGIELNMIASSTVEQQEWVAALQHSIDKLKLEQKMIEAQRIDMMTMLQIKMQLDEHEKSAVMEKEGFLEKQAIKSKRNWKRRFFTLKEGVLAYQATQDAKKPIMQIKLSALSVVIARDEEGEGNEKTVQTVTVQRGSGTPCIGAGNEEGEESESRFKA